MKTGKGVSISDSAHAPSNTGQEDLFLDHLPALRQGHLAQVVQDWTNATEVAAPSNDQWITLVIAPTGLTTATPKASISDQNIYIDMKHCEKWKCSLHTSPIARTGLTRTPWRDLGSSAYKNSCTAAESVYNCSYRRMSPVQAASSMYYHLAPRARQSHVITKPIH